MQHTVTPSRTVLIVEDEPMILMGAVDIVEEAGYRAYTAGSAGAAIKLLEAHNDIDILFTDIEMPGAINGLDLAHVVHERWPAMAIVIVSGMTTIRAVDLPKGAVFVSKPYLTKQILSGLDRLCPRAGS